MIHLSKTQQIEIADRYYDYLVNNEICRIQSVYLNDGQSLEIVGVLLEAVASCLKDKFNNFKYIKQLMELSFLHDFPEYEAEPFISVLQDCSKTDIEKYDAIYKLIQEANLDE